MIFDQAGLPGSPSLGIQADAASVVGVLDCSGVF